MLHRTIVAFSVVAFQASAQECGLGDFVCDGEALAYGGKNPSFQNNHTVEKLEDGWWQVEVLAGGNPPAFKEYQYCTQSPEADLPARLNISAGSNLICVAGARTDMKDPTVRVTWHYEDCDTFVKVVQTATATSTTDDSKTLDEVARITCRRESLATARLLREQTPVLPKEAPPVRVRDQVICPWPAWYACTGEMYERPDGENGFGDGHFVTITGDRNFFASTLEPGWWESKVKRDGVLTETAFCARTPDADGKGFTAPSTFWCSTESRSDQDEPAVSTYLHHHDCNRFIKVVTVGPALKKGTQEATKPQIAMLQCDRESQLAVTAEELPPSPVRNQAADEVCKVGEFTCEGEERNSTRMFERDSYIETLASPAEGWWTLNGDVATSMCLKSAESTTRNDITSGADMMCVQHDVARPVYVHVHFSDCNSYQKVLVRGASQAGDPMARVQCVRKPPPTDKVGLTSLSFFALAVSLVTVAADF